MKFSNANKKEIREFKEMNGCSMEDALTGLCKQYYEQYYGNSNK
jgi:hypothetical protein